MLVDVKLREPDAILATLAAVLHNGPAGATRLRQGVYQCNHWNFENLFQLPIGDRFERTYPELPGDLGAFGVCDSLDQLLAKCPELQTGETAYCVCIVSVKRETQPEQCGWRWHKWGEYIGEQNPQNEYLYDDKHIDEVFTYHVYEVLPEERAT